MDWVRSGWKSVAGWIGPSVTHTESRTAQRIEQVRAAMLDPLCEFAGGDHVRLEVRIRYCADAQGLWYLRSEWMSALCNSLDEAKAQRMLKDLTTQFKGLVPAEVLRSASRRHPRSA